MEDQIGALGLVLNALVLFNTRYMDAALTQLRAETSTSATPTSPGSHPSCGTTSTCLAATPSSSPSCPEASGRCIGRRREPHRAFYALTSRLVTPLTM